MGNTVRELRPAEIVWQYWDQVTVLEENAQRLAVEYIEWDAR